ncbi:hypothetical protein [Calothrix sp. CCY 0018]|uniref:hypothetical protein n=1 Tax=Calothrix sp. CCY 0018 TaxID=3103864 RepID=UPI0039C61D0A
MGLFGKLVKNIDFDNIGFGVVKPVVDSISDIGVGVIKNTGKIAWGTGQTIAGFVSESDELIETGLKNVQTGAVALTSSLIIKNIVDKDEEDV